MINAAGTSSAFQRSAPLHFPPGGGHGQLQAADQPGAAQAINRSAMRLPCVSESCCRATQMCRRAPQVTAAQAHATAAAARLHTARRDELPPRLPGGREAGPRLRRVLARLKVQQRQLVRQQRRQPAPAGLVADGDRGVLGRLCLAVAKDGRLRTTCQSARLRLEPKFARLCLRLKEGRIDTCMHSATSCVKRATPGSLCAQAALGDRQRLQGSTGGRHTFIWYSSLAASSCCFSVEASEIRSSAAHSLATRSWGVRLLVEWSTFFSSDAIPAAGDPGLPNAAH